MNKLKALSAAAVIAALLLSSCSGVLVEDMLTAPALTADQIAVIKAIEATTSEKTVLKYPLSGSDRSPVHFIDLDDDKTDEAVAFFSVPAEGLKAKIAVLDSDAEGRWYVAGCLDGGGTDVGSLNLMHFDVSQGKLMLVEWTSTSISEHKITVYHYRDGQLTPGFEDRCSDILVLDLDSDGFSEFCYISEQPVPGNASINYADIAGDSFTIVSSYPIAGEFSGASISKGRLSDGKTAVFVDESVAGDVESSEVFIYSEGVFMKADYGGEYDILALAERPEGTAQCKTLSKQTVTFIPSAVAPYEGIAAKDALTFWYSVGSGEIEYEAASLVMKEYGCCLVLPEKWLQNMIVTMSEENPRLVVLTNDEAGVVVEIQVLSLGDSADALLAGGFELIDRSGSYRFYIRSNASDEDTGFLRENFTIL